MKKLEKKQCPELEFRLISKLKPTKVIFIVGYL